MPEAQHNGDEEEEGENDVGLSDVCLPLLHEEYEI